MNESLREITDLRKLLKEVKGVFKENKINDLYEKLRDMKIVSKELPYKLTVDPREFNELMLNFNIDFNEYTIKLDECTYSFKRIKQLTGENNIVVNKITNKSYQVFIKVEDNTPTMIDESNLPFVLSTLTWSILDLEIKKLKRKLESVDKLKKDLVELNKELGI